MTVESDANLAAAVERLEAMSRPGCMGVLDRDAVEIVLAALTEATGRAEAAEADADRLAVALQALATQYRQALPGTWGVVQEALVAHDALVAKRADDAASSKPRRMRGVHQRFGGAHDWSPDCRSQGCIESDDA